MLAESATEFCVLKCFQKAVQSAWGMVPLQIRTVVPTLSIEKLKTVTKKAAKGIQYIV